MNEEAGRIHQRAAQKRRRRTELVARRTEAARTREGLRRQYIQTANIHKREGLDPIQGAPVPAVIVIQDKKARRFAQYTWTAFGSGTLLAAVLFGVSLEAHEVGAVFGAIFMGLLAGVAAAAVILSTSSDPEHPESMKTLALLGSAGGVGAFTSLFLVLWLRFAQDVEGLQQMAVPVAVLETCLFLLGGVFAAVSIIYRWSRDITDAYDRATAELIGFEEEIVNLDIDLQALKFEQELEELQAQQRRETAGSKSGDPAKHTMVDSK